MPHPEKTAILYRMVMPDHVCPYGRKSLWLLKRKGYRVDDRHLTTRAETDAFKAKHDVKTTPQTFIDGRRIGGHDDLRRFFGQKVPAPGQTSYTPVLAVFAVALLIARHLFGSELAGAIAGGAAFLGHLFPVWLGFKGGKGVATFYGLLLAAAWPLGLMAGAVWLLSAFLFRYSSLAALISSAAAPLLALLPLAAVGLPVGRPILILTVFAAVLIWVRHHQNIARLLKGEEPRIGAKKA